MKRFFTFLLTMMAVSVMAQMPSNMSYQAVIRDNSNQLLANTQVGVEITILQGSPGGTVIYVEEHTITTNANGLISLEIGNGTNGSGNLGSIDWANGPYFIETATDPSGGTAYSIIGTTPLLTVPYARHARRAEVADTANESDPVFGSSVASGITIGDTANWNSKLDSYSETDPVFGNSIAAGITGADTSSWHNKLDSYTETDPAFTAWDKSTGISITESQVSDLGNYIETEADPVFGLSVASGITANDTAIWHNKLDSYTETDPIFTNWDKSTGISIAESQISDLGNYIETEADPVFGLSVSAGITGTDTSNWNNKLDSFTETDPMFSSSVAAGISSSDTANWNSISVFSGNYDDLSNKPVVLQSSNFMTATGYESFNSNQTSGVYNTANGYQSLMNNTTGDGNTAVGFKSLYSNSTGYENVAIGKLAMESNTNGIRNVGIGEQCLRTSTSGSNNIGVGFWALRYNTSGSRNIAIGPQALRDNTTGSDNTAIGYEALYENRRNSKSTAVGYKAMRYAYSGSVSRETFNTALGVEALRGSTNSSQNSGRYNTAVGARALFVNSTGDNNSAFGRRALAANLSGDNNTAIGVNSMQANTSGLSNISMGYSSLLNNSTGDDNVAIGVQSLQDNTNGNENTAIGNFSLDRNRGNQGSVAIGFKAMEYADSRNIGRLTKNTAIGYEALKGTFNAGNNTGTQNTSIGYRNLVSNSSGSNNTSIGVEALTRNSSGSYNTSVGFESLWFTTTGNNNTAIGRQAGYYNITGSNNIFIGYNTFVPNPNGNNQIRIGNNLISYAGIQVPWTVTSDIKWKKEIREIPLGLEFVSMLRPVDYIRKNNEANTREAGYIAQDVQKLLIELGIEDSGMLMEDHDGSLQLRYNDFIPILTKAIQEQQELIENQKTEINDLKAENSVIRTDFGNRLDALEFYLGLTPERNFDLGNTKYEQ